MSDGKVTAFIPARGGSKGLPRKNLVQLCGKPLIDYAIDAARDSGVVHRIIVSTDDHDIAAHARSKGCDVHDRPARLASDTSRVVDAVIDAASTLHIDDIDVVVVLQPTSPLRGVGHIVQALDLYRSSAHAVVSVVECEHHPLKSVTVSDGVLAPAFAHEYLEASRQDLPKFFRPNGAIYVATLGSVREHRTLVRPGAAALVMTAEDSIDIDVPADLEHADVVLRRRQK